MLHYISTTWVCMLHYMPKNDYRSGKRQVSMVVDEGLWWAVKAIAGQRGVSVTALVTELLQDLVSDVQPVSAASPTVPAARTAPDWDSIMERGLVAREAVASVGLDRDRERTVSLYGVSDTVSDGDPLGEIA